MYQALYRKWRPQTFDDVIGQDHIVLTLKNEIAMGRVSHAYLFCGTRGTGKTSCSKILAKAVNCPHQVDGNPCCACAVCKGIDQSAVLDVTEIDAASNNGVDNIRELREEANFTPAMTKYRVYIIDETHMLSAGAFNALLKIMEEPPEHVLFVLATTEIHKVPATIISRCQRFDFHRIDSATIAARLLYVAEQENLQLSEDAALLIARLSDGGMRDALSLLDLCCTATGEITVETVRHCGGLIGQTHLFAIAKAVGDKDHGAALAVLQDLWGQSIDYQRLCEQLITFYRNLMIAKTVARPEELITCLPDELEQYRLIARETALEEILSALTILQDTLSRMRHTPLRRTELEMGLLKLCSPPPTSSSQALLTRIDRLEQKLLTAHLHTAPAAQPAQPPSPTEEEIRKTPVEKFERWQEVLDILKEKNKALYGALIESTAYIGGGLFLIDAGQGSVFAQIVRGDSYAKESLRAAVFAVTNEKFRLGPYNAAKYEVTSASIDPLEGLLKRASELGVDVNLK